MTIFVGATFTLILIENVVEQFRKHKKHIFYSGINPKNCKNAGRKTKKMKADGITRMSDTISLSKKNTGIIFAWNEKNIKHVAPIT